MLDKISMDNSLKGKHEKKLENDSEQVQSHFSPRAIIEEAYERYADELYQYALMILADHGAAENAVQQVFMKVIKMEKHVLQVESYNGYLRTAVRNECYVTIKKRKRFDGLIKILSSRPILLKLTDPYQILPITVLLTTK